MAVATLDIHGRLSVAVIRPDGTVRERRVGDNIICTTGYSALAAALVWSGIQDQAGNLGVTNPTYLTPLYGAVGDGAGIPQASDTALFAELGRQAVGAGAASPASGAIAAEASWLFYFPSPGTEWTLTEAGVFTAASADAGSGSMLDHWSFSPYVVVPTTDTLILQASFALGGSSVSLPLSVFTAASIELIACTGDPNIMPGSPGPTAGRPYFHRCYVDRALAATKMTIDVLQADSGVTACYLGVYDVDTGDLLAQTANIASSLATAQIVNASLQSTLDALPVNKEIYLAFLVAGNTTLQLVGGRQYGTNQTMTDDARLYTNSGGAQLSTLPSTLPALVQTAGFTSLFIGLGP